MKAKMPKIKIPAHDIEAFTTESLMIDPFWYDLYGIETNNALNKNTIEF